MAHELSIRESGKVEHAFVGRVGWHGLGTELKEGASIEDWQEAAGMDWTLRRARVRFATGRDHETLGPSGLTEFPDRIVIFRSDTKAPLSVVSDGFKLVQPSDVLGFFRDLVADNGYRLETAGVLFGGRQFWALATAGQTAEIGKGDYIRRYLLLSTSCDGSRATDARETDVRVVCANTLGAADRSAGRVVRVTHRTVFDADAAKKELRIGKFAEEGVSFSDQMDLFRRLASTPLPEGEVVEMTTELFHPGAAKKARDEYVRAIQSRPVVGVTELYFEDKAKGATLDGVKGTAWGWLNSVTEYVDHHAQAKNDDSRLASAWFGRGDALKTRALELAGAA